MPVRSSPEPLLNQPTMKVASTTGRLQNEHFLIVADHLLLTLNSENFDLVDATAVGNVEIRMTHRDGEIYTAFVESAIYQAALHRIIGTGWKGSEHDGVAYTPTPDRLGLVLPTDGSFFDEQEDMPEEPQESATCT